MKFDLLADMIGAAPLPVFGQVRTVLSRKRPTAVRVYGLVGVARRLPSAETAPVRPAEG